VAANPKEKTAREALIDLLGYWTNIKAAGAGDSLKQFSDWFAKNFPREAAGLAAGSNTDLSHWRKRFVGLKWDDGEATRGKHIFEERGCVRCHTGSGRLGPDLSNVAQRLSRDDLFVAMLDPSREIAPTYLPKVIHTKSENSYTGFIVYDSPQVTLLQTGPDATVRLTGEEITSVRTGEVSIMPDGLLDGLKEGDLADLYAYIKTIRK